MSERVSKSECIARYRNEYACSNLFQLLDSTSTSRRTSRDVVIKVALRPTADQGYSPSRIAEYADASARRHEGRTLGTGIRCSLAWSELGKSRATPHA